MASNDPTGLAQALEDIEALKKERRDQRAQFEVFARFVRVSLENIAEYRQVERRPAVDRGPV
jgi:hypothetical protein